jgi:hypothetical protein
MPLKYQREIDDLKIDLECPSEVSIPNNLTAYRWSFLPISHALNFVPNVVFDRETKAPFNYQIAKPQIKCKRCGASYFTNAEGAINRWENLSLQNRLNMGYTHLAIGVLDAADGVMRKPDSDGHFGFYEDEDADLVSKFKPMNILNVAS